MKKLVFSLLLIGVIAISGLAGYAVHNHSETAVKEGDLGSPKFTTLGKEGDLGSSIFSLKFLNK